MSKKINVRFVKVCHLEDVLDVKTSITAAQTINRNIGHPTDQFAMFRGKFTKILIKNQAKLSVITANIMLKYLTGPK